jgi:hypothetical protein
MPLQLTQRVLLVLTLTAALSASTMAPTHATATLPPQQVVVVHRPVPGTPLDRTASAPATPVRQSRPTPTPAPATPPVPAPAVPHPAARPSTPPVQPPTRPAPAPEPSPAGNPQAYARDLVGDAQFACLDSIWQHESGWDYTAANPSSGAYGIPQALPGSKMASAGADWHTNPLTQIRWGISYIHSRYGTPCAAWSFWQTHHWY